MSVSDRLGLPYIAPQQAQKHVTHNEAVRRLDALVQMSVESRLLSAPPGDAQAGEAHIAASPASGDWTAGENAVWVFQDGAWRRYAPREGWIVWVKDEATAIAWSGSAWISLAAGGAGDGVSLQDLAAGAADRLGVNTLADAVNRLAVKSDAVFFSHDDVTPGVGDCRLAVNKVGAAATASLLFQTNAAARAELGLTGDDKFHLKVSPDGAAFANAMVVDNRNGRIGVGTDSPQAELDVFDGTIRLTASDGGRIAEITDISGAANNGAIRIFNDAGAEAMRLSSATDSWVDLDLGVGTNSPSGKLHVSGGGCVIGAPAGGDRGAGTLNAQAVYDDNVLLSCYVFDQALDGAVDSAKWDAKVPDRVIPERKINPGMEDERTIEPAQRIVRNHGPLRRFKARLGTDHDPLTLDGYARHWREKRHLPSMPNEENFDPVLGAMSAGEWIQRLVETVEIQAVLIEALNRRTRDLTPERERGA